MNRKLIAVMLIVLIGFIGLLIENVFQDWSSKRGTYNNSLNKTDITVGNTNISQPINTGRPQPINTGPQPINTNGPQPIIEKGVTPIILNIDLRKLPIGRNWQKGDPVSNMSDELGSKNETTIISSASKVSTKEASTNGILSVQNEKSTKNESSALSMPLVNRDGIPFTGALPPDPVGDVGPNHYIQAVNWFGGYDTKNNPIFDSRFAIFDKTGNVLVGNNSNGILVGLNMNQLWIAAGVNDECANSPRGDPIVRYDHLADRWILGQMANETLNTCIAVSRTPDPVGPWALYNFFTNGIPKDYEKLGIWPDAYYVGTNKGYGGGNAWAFDRANMLNGTTTRNDLGFDTDEFMLPSDDDGPAPPNGAPNVFLRFIDGEEFGGVDRLELREFHVDFDRPFPPFTTFTPLPNIPTNEFDAGFCGTISFFDNCVQQPGTSNLLDTNRAFMLYRLQYRNFGGYETLVTNHNVNVSNRTGIKWYELHKVSGAWSIFQEGTYSPDTTNRWFGSIAMDKDGNMVVGYSVSSLDVFPGIRYAGRLANDDLGTFPQGENTLIDGSSSQISYDRWGDYTAMTVDPSDDCTFWYTNEYYNSSAIWWSTRFGNFRFCSAVLETIDSVTITGYDSYDNYQRTVVAHPGDYTHIIVYFTNTGTSNRSYWIGLSYQKPDGSWYDVPPQQTRNIPQYGEDFLDFNWKLPLDAPIGIYRMKVNIWNDYNGSTMIEPEYDQKTSLAFTVVSDNKCIDIYCKDFDKTNGNIDSFRSNQNKYNPGDIIYSTIKVSNTGLINKSYWVGLSYQKPDGSWYDVPPQHTKNLTYWQLHNPFGNNDTIQELSFDWKLPLDAPIGNYKVRIAIWDDYNGITMIGTAYDQKDSPAFIVVEK